MSSGESGLKILKVYDRSEWKQPIQSDKTDPAKKTLFEELLRGFQKNGHDLNGNTGKTNEN